MPIPRLYEIWRLAFWFCSALSCCQKNCLTNFWALHKASPISAKICPCAGPIMAAAIVQIIQAKSSLEAALTVAMFALGAGIPMLFIALLGRTIIGHLNFLKSHSYAVRRILGVIIIAAAALIYSGADVE